MNEQYNPVEDEDEHKSVCVEGYPQERYGADALNEMVIEMCANLKKGLEERSVKLPERLENIIDNADKVCGNQSSAVEDLENLKSVIEQWNNDDGKIVAALVGEGVEGLRGEQTAQVIVAIENVLKGANIQSGDDTIRALKDFFENTKEILDKIIELKKQD